MECCCCFCKHVKAGNIRWEAKDKEDADNKKKQSMFYGDYRDVFIFLSVFIFFFVVSVFLMHWINTYSLDSADYILAGSISFFTAGYIYLDDSKKRE